MRVIQFDSVKGFCICMGIEMPKQERVSGNDSCWIYDNELHKFPKDEINTIGENAEEVHFLGGYIFNKEDFGPIDNWERNYINYTKTSSFPEQLRGGFCGICRQNDGCIKVFTDHVGSRAIYYWVNANRIIISNRVNFIVNVLKACGQNPGINEDAVKSMLEVGFMVDDSTYVKGVKRVLPGCYVSINIRSGEIRNHRYYLLNNNEDSEITEEKAICEIDRLFRKAVKRICDKNAEGGYIQLNDLSGGLDSRMASWVAHDLGYKNQINICYCREDYLDFKIAKKIAKDLRHVFLFMPLDDFKWYGEYEQIVNLNNGAAIYSGITGGNVLLSLLSSNQIGIEHTGMAGDAILSTFFKNNRERNFSVPNSELVGTKSLIRYGISPQTEYSNNEQYMFHTRVTLGAQSSYMIRQNYFECASPFLDVDFLNYIFRVPYNMRDGYNIYNKWILSRYPQAANYGWEKIDGLKITSSNFAKKLDKVKKMLYWGYVRIVGGQKRDSMNPFEYWLMQNNSIKNDIMRFYLDNKSIVELLLPQELCTDIDMMIKCGKSAEMEKALTVVTFIKKYCEV